MLRIRISTDNDVFQGGGKWSETAKILRDLANRLDRESGAYGGVLNLFDENGNHVGAATLS